LNDLFGSTSEPIRDPPKTYQPRSQGAEANHKGAELEKQVGQLFVTRGAIVVPFEKYRRKTDDMFDDRSLVRQFQYVSMFGKEYKRRVDLVYFHGPNGPRVAIECKVQDDSGSVDEKLPGLYLESREWQFVDHVWFVLSGGGFRKCWERWLVDAGNLRGTKTVRVFTSMDELRKPVRMLVEHGDPLAGYKR
jgi:hypothetical protein